MNNNQLQRNLLIEFEEKGYDLEKLKPYSDFLIECSHKDYTDLATHIHHIFPKSMNGGIYLKETIELSLEDHFQSHYILAHCFDSGTDGRRMNLSACKYIKVHIKRYMKKINHDVPESMLEFWNLANKLMIGIHSGENNTFFGKKHTDETRKVIKEKRALQVFSDESIKKMADRLRSLPNNQKGEQKPYFGLTFDERFGLEKSKEIKAKLKAISERRNSTRPLPEGIYKCDIIIDGQQKYFYRVCPCCLEKIYYKGVSAVKCGQPITTAQREKCKCQVCRTREYVRINPIIKINHTSNHLVIKDLDTNKIYNSMSDAAIELNTTLYQIKKKLKLGLFEIVNDRRTGDR